MSHPSPAGPGRLAVVLALLLCLAFAGPALAAAPPALFGSLGLYDFVADRSRMLVPVLLGRHALEPEFVVDPARKYVLSKAAKPDPDEYLAEMRRIRAMTPEPPPGVEPVEGWVLIREDRDSR